MMGVGNKYCLNRSFNFRAFIWLNLKLMKRVNGWLFDVSKQIWIVELKEIYLSKVGLSNEPNDRPSQLNHLCFLLVSNALHQFSRWHHRHRLFTGTCSPNLAFHWICILKKKCLAEWKDNIDVFRTFFFHIPALNLNSSHGCCNENP